MFWQLAVTAALVASPHQPLVDREAFGVRYRTPAIHGMTAQAGVFTADDNGIADKKIAGTRHFAVGVEYALTSALRTSLIYGNFDEIRDPVEGLPHKSYYRLWAVGLDLHGAGKALSVEKLIQAPLQTHAAIHDVVVRGSWGPVSGMLTSIHHSYNQAPYHFVTAEATWVVWRNVGITGGTRAVLSSTADTERLLPFAGVGLFLHWSHSA